MPNSVSKSGLRAIASVINCASSTFCIILPSAPQMLKLCDDGGRKGELGCTTMTNYKILWRPVSMNIPCQHVSTHVTRETLMTLMTLIVFPIICGHDLFFCDALPNSVCLDERPFPLGSFGPTHECLLVTEFLNAFAIPCVSLDYVLSLSSTQSKLTPSFWNPKGNLT